MNINRKFIIIFGTLILLLIIITGGIVYYQEKAGLASQDEYFSAPIPEDKEYEIWCYDYDGQWKDCMERATFWPKQLVSISVNLEKFDNIPYEPYFLCLYTDLKGEVEGKKICSGRFPNFLVIENSTIPEDKEIFSLLKLVVYPDNSFKESDERVIMDLEGKLIK